MQIKRIAEGGGIKEKYGPVIGLSHDVDIPEKYNRITLKSKLQYYLEEIAEIALNLKPFLPETVDKIAKIFGSPVIKSGEALFPRLK